MNTMTTQAQVRDSFWEHYAHFANERRSRKRQNDYRCDIRVSFVDFVDWLNKEGYISDSLANRVTL